MISVVSVSGRRSSTPIVLMDRASEQRGREGGETRERGERGERKANDEQRERSSFVGVTGVYCIPCISGLTVDDGRPLISGKGIRVRHVQTGCDE